MMQSAKKIGLLLTALVSLTACSPLGSKAYSISVIYGAMAFLSLLLLIGYCLLARKKETWFLLLFASVIVVNIGYLSLSVSENLEEALLANRIAYLGSVFLPMSILMTLLRVCKLSYGKWLPATLLTVSLLVFLLAASPGYLDWYYAEVSLQVICGVSVLEKSYGPLHSVYLFYLLLYFGAMVAVIVYATQRRKNCSRLQMAILLVAVLVNLSVWFIEQMVKIDFEFLSVSYVITELFLLCICVGIEAEERKAEGASKAADLSAPAAIGSEKRTFFAEQVESLTPTEKIIYDLYVEGRSTKEVLATLGIKENTLKYHNKNIYSKLGVSSRKELLAIATEGIVRSE